MEIASRDKTHELTINIIIATVKCFIVQALGTDYVTFWSKFIDHSKLDHFRARGKNTSAFKMVQLTKGVRKLTKIS